MNIYKKTEQEETNELSKEEKENLIDQLKTFVEKESKIIITFASLFLIMVIPMGLSLLNNPSENLTGTTIEKPAPTETPITTPFIIDSMSQ